MQIIMGMTQGIRDGMATAHIGTAVRIGMPAGGMTHGTTHGFTAGIVRGVGITLGIGRYHITVLIAA